MAKLSGLISDGKVAQADPKVVAAMPAMAAAQAIEPAELSAAENASGITGDQVTELSLSQLRRSPFQVRTMGDDSYIESLMESIQASGVISPVVVRRLPPEKSSNFELFELVAGEHRAEACRRLGHKTIRAIVKDLSDAQAAIALASDNAVRKNLDDYDRYKHSKMLIERGFCRTSREVAATLGVKSGFVSMLNAFEVLPEGVKTLLEQQPGLLGAATVYQIKDLAVESPASVTQAVSLVATGKLKQTNIKHWVLTHTHSVTRKERDTYLLERSGRPAIKLVVSDDEAVIKAAGLNIFALKELIEKNLDSLLSVEKVQTLNVQPAK